VAQSPVVYVDVDDTLVRSVGTKRIPMPGVVERVHRLHREGAALYLWSRGGADYARETAQELGVSECFLAFLPKPTLIIDDQPFTEWRDFRHEYPTST
jgi:cation transport ATPase